mmetsp:Transcript_17169/g.51249  ORF Transcript_17169/g.51249 Transcript_17169/m.51249 type:complete len:250 (+) Transcript_17169:218-967(+)
MSAPDAVDVKSWMLAGAPTESARPYAPVETSLPDPELLPARPPLRALPGRCVAWTGRNPKAALAHLVAIGGLLAAAAASLAPLALTDGPTYIRNSCWRAIACRFFTAFFSLRLLALVHHRYVLYQAATRYQLQKGITLEQVTVARLTFRRFRGPGLMLVMAPFLVQGVLVACAAKGRDALCAARAGGAFDGAAQFLDVALVSLALAIPAAYWILNTYGSDPVEDADVQAKMQAARAKRGCGHNHGHGGG